MKTFKIIAQERYVEVVVNIFHLDTATALLNSSEF